MGHCERCDELRERIRLLEGIIGTNEDVPLEFNLTERERQILGILLRRERANMTTFFHVLYGDRSEPPHEANIGVYLHRMRRKLQPFGITIDRVPGRGSGWCLSRENKVKIFSILNGESCPR